MYSVGIMLYSIYRGATGLSGPFLKSLLHKRLDKGKEDAARYTERYAQTSINRPNGKVMWLHGASVGEALSILPLLNTLQSRLPDWHFLLTTGTVTSAELMAKRLPDNVVHQFVPWDHPVWVKRFFDHWQPDAVIWLESELWPNILHEITTRQIPAGLINARMRPSSQKKWRYAPGLGRKMLSAFTFTLTGAREYLPVFKAMGAKNVSYIGSLKFGARPLPVDIKKLDAMKTMIGDRPCIGFLQTHPSEEIMAAEILQSLRQIKPDLLGIIVPRNNTRGRAIQDEIKNTALRTANEIITPQTQIYIADTIGEMGLWYSLCPTAVIGGSFIPFGGQNPIEGTHFSTAILYGPGMFNFPELCLALEEAKAAKRVCGKDELLATLQQLLQQPETLQAMRHASHLLANQNVSVIDAFADEIMIQLVGQS